MRIGFDAKRLFCNLRGLGNYSRTLLNSLNKHFPENEYHLYTPRINRIEQTQDFLDPYRYALHLPTSSFHSYWRSFSIVDQLRKDGIEIYHGLSHEIPINLHKTSIKSVVTMHDLIFRANTNAHSFIDRNLYNIKYRHSCKHADRIVAISENTKNDIVRFYGINPNKIDVIYQPCNSLFYNPRGEEDNINVLKKLGIDFDYFMFVGSAEPNKNLKLVVEVYSTLPSDLRIPILIIGRGNNCYKKEVLEQIAKHKLEKYFIWICDLNDNRDLQSLYQKSKGLIFPSFYEGFGLPIVEALLCQAPVIASNTSSLPEAGGPNTLYVNPSNPKELSVAIERLLSDDQLATRMKQEGYQYAINNFSHENYAKQVLATYRKTLQ
ncbi:glycosyltransferase family 4 protein [Acetobacteroides hydrogenigenes]|uniref:Glycosyltransferase involved in cell wall biosynthesis n=1 Tax=Acetobacteroides hydrogenigenes TaxID=979970 RepID=A0A4R2EPG0_9BACT|nr:glycosyltransferase family 1 protein [Acetobacteroides hydrogenigenes]TCN70227.1 glycosyltransferase involved in cell wall biosynthesis [Acetobacteroides hydrogenigenes]